jgi:hypothetical protein
MAFEGEVVIQDGRTVVTAEVPRRNVPRFVSSTARGIAASTAAGASADSISSRSRGTIFTFRLYTVSRAMTGSP